MLHVTVEGGWKSVDWPISVLFPENKGKDQSKAGGWGRKVLKGRRGGGAEAPTPLWTVEGGSYEMGWGELFGREREGTIMHWVSL